MKLKRYIILTLLILASGLYLSQCSGPSEPDFSNPYDTEGGAYIPAPDLNTAPITDISVLEARSGGEFTNDYGKPVTQKGVCWSTSESPTVEDNCTSDGEGLGPFESHLIGLIPGQKHYIRAYATNDDGSFYGGVRSFTTLTGVPELETGDVDEIRALSAVARASLGEENGSEVLDWGLCYNLLQTPDEEICLSASHEQLLAGGVLDKIVELYFADEINRRDAVTKRERVLASRERARPAPLVGPLTETTSNREQVAPANAAQLERSPGLHQVREMLGQKRTGFPETEQVNSSGQNKPQPVPQILKNAGGSFTIQLTNLLPDANYQVRAWAVNDAIGVSYGNSVTFTTMDGIPEIQSQPAASITAFTASVESTVQTDGGDTITSRGLCYSESPNPDQSDNCLESGDGTGTFTVSLENLSPDTKYYTRAYAENAVGTRYGNEIEFTTNDGLPGIFTAPATEIRAFSAQTGGTINTDGEAPVTGRGVCYSTSENPTLENTCVASGQGEGSFSIALEELTLDTQYFARAYSQSEAGVAYGNEITFTTKKGIPQLTTSLPAEVMAFTARVGGSIFDDGGTPITGRGVCYGTQPNPGFADSCIETGVGMGSFDVILEDLTADTGYFVRAYATNVVGTVFGNQQTFTTNDGLPEVTTTEATDIFAFSAQVGGETSGNGGAIVIGRGVCFDTEPNPTDEAICVEAGEGDGNFVAELSPLVPDTQYYAKAYSQSAVGIAYGNEVIFVTRDGIPEVATAGIEEVMASQALVEGEITDDGGASIVERGFCYGMQPNPGFQDNCVSTGTGTGTYQALIEGLNSGTQYFVSAYATTQMGSFFAEELGFVTKFALDIIIEGSGMVTQSSGFYEPGVVLDLIPQPLNGWFFFEWSGDASGNNNPLSLIMDSDKTVIANFSKNITDVVEIVNPETGRIWMDRNMGASRLAMSSTDTQAYGDLYQWGRASDRHQIRNSETNPNLSSTDIPGHNDFIITSEGPLDWRSPQNDNLWQGFDGVNNMCPDGFRIPTEAEWDTERNSWSNNNATGAFDSILKLTVAGIRGNDNGSLFNVGSYGFYWSSTVSGTSAQFLYFDSSSASIMNSYRANGLSVRCIKGITSTLSISVSPLEAGTVSGAGVFEQGSTVNIDASPNEGYVFVGWSGSTEAVEDVNAANTTLIMPSNNINLTANFVIDVVDNETEVAEVINPATGRTWMDRNLGATRAATSSTDAQAYGDLYQWGRAADGHQKRNSPTTSTLSNTDQPGHGSFILSPNSPFDWRSPQNDNLWQGVNGINNPCPSGYRLPTEAEWITERNSWSSNNAAGAINSPLKLPMAGSRSFSSGSLINVGSHGLYWSASVSGSSARYLRFDSSLALMSSNGRALGYSVRCLED